MLFSLDTHNKNEHVAYLSSDREKNIYFHVELILQTTGSSICANKVIDLN